MFSSCPIGAEVVFKHLPCDSGVSSLSEGFICLLRLLACGGCNLPKISLYVKNRGRSRSAIASVPLNRLIELAHFPKRSWYFKDGWLVLEGTI